jgi:hypothetical protein
LIKASRLFVSATFADFAAERDVLQREVFPALDTYCTARGYQYYPLDLRWGLNEEAQLDQRTTEICLNEVRAARQGYPLPDFLIMIGNRYGPLQAISPAPAIIRWSCMPVRGWQIGSDGAHWRQRCIVDLRSLLVSIVGDLAAHGRVGKPASTSTM